MDYPTRGLALQEYLPHKGTTHFVVAPRGGGASAKRREL